MEKAKHLKELPMLFFSGAGNTQVTLWNLLMIYLVYFSSKWLQTQMLML